MTPAPNEERDGLVRNLWGGCVTRDKRHSGDTFSDLASGCIDENATDRIMAQAADYIGAQAAEITRLRAEVARKDEALKPFAASCIDVSGTAAIGVSQSDIDRARAARMPAEGRAALEQEGR